MYILFHAVMIGILGTTMYICSLVRAQSEARSNFEDIGSGDRRPSSYRAIARVKRADNRSRG
jgi:hypothetical protein